MFNYITVNIETQNIRCFYTIARVAREFGLSVDNIRDVIRSESMVSNGGDVFCVYVIPRGGRLPCDF